MFTRFSELVSALMRPAPALDLPAAGLYHFERRQEEARSRLHLRLNPDGSALLLINASRTVTFNASAAHMAYLALKETPLKSAVDILRRTYQAPAAQLQSDYQAFCTQLDELIRPDGACPICDLDVDVIAPFSQRPVAPYRMDLALTYRCNNDCAHCYNVSDRQDPELTTNQWKQIIDRLWEIGIPHIVFTGGEPSMRTDLPELIAHAESRGQITGLNTNGRRLSDPRFLQSLIDAGLDHVQITVESHDPEIHDAMVGRKGAWRQTIQGVRNAVASRLFVMTNTTMLQNNAHVLRQTLEFLAEIGVPTVGLNALIYSGRGASVGTGLREAELPALLDLARQFTETHGQRLIWYTPTQYCHFDPVQLDLGVKGCTAALYNMCIEPDGGVLPCQSYYRQVGNLLRDEWSSIWNNPLCLWLRDRQYAPAACQGCGLLAECGGGCPLQIDAAALQPAFIPLGKLTQVS